MQDRRVQMPMQVDAIGLRANAASLISMVIAWLTTSREAASLAVGAYRSM